MKKTKIFQSGNSKAVRLPKEFHIEGDEVEIFRRDNEIVLREIPKNLAQAFVLLSQLPDDFFAEVRKDEPPQERDF